LGTLWKLHGNTLETREKTKKMTALPPLKEKNWIVHECILSLPIGCMKFLFPKLLVTVLAWANGRGRIWGHSSSELYCAGHFIAVVGYSGQIILL